MNRSELIIKTEEFVKENLKGYDSGHDWWHIERVRGLARHINMVESLAEPFTMEITALLHDSADSKFSGEDIEAGYLRIAEFMDKPGLSEIKDQVIEVIRSISFSSKHLSENPTDPLLHLIQDADRLDAIGAIGIARAFNYGGFRNNTIYNPGDESGGRSTIGHFYEKLLLLKLKMNTETAKKLAAERHEFLELFLERFYNEWEFAIS
jgi:uncharacterized protein